MAVRATQVGKSSDRPAAHRNAARLIPQDPNVVIMNSSRCTSNALQRAASTGASIFSRTVSHAKTPTSMSTGVSWGRNPPCRMPPSTTPKSMNHVTPYSDKTFPLQASSSLSIATNVGRGTSSNTWQHRSSNEKHSASTKTVSAALTTAAHTPKRQSLRGAPSLRWKHQKHLAHDGRAILLVRGRQAAVAASRDFLRWLW